jgi:hypothetical protein
MGYDPFSCKMMKRSKADSIVLVFYRYSDKSSRKHLLLLFLMMHAAPTELLDSSCYF